MLGPAVFSIREHWVPKASPVASEHPPTHMPLAPTLLPQGSRKQDSGAWGARVPPAWKLPQELIWSEASPATLAGQQMVPSLHQKTLCFAFSLESPS